MQTPLNSSEPPVQKYNSLLLLIKLSLTCGLSAFYYGYCTTFFNSINFQQIVQIFSLQAYPRALTQGLLTGSTCITGAIGTVLSVQLISRFSRRECLMLISSATFLLTLLALIPNIVTLVFVRLMQGLLIGCISCITPLYMREMMPKEVSGPLWSLHQVLFVIGTSFGFLLTFLLSFFMPTSSSWRIIFGFPLLTSSLQLVLFNFLYRFDTPKWAILNNNVQKARQTLIVLYKPEFVQGELREVIRANDYVKGNKMDRVSVVSQVIVAEVELQKFQADGVDNQEGNEMEIIKGEKIENKQEKLVQKKSMNNSLAVFTAFFLIGQQQFMGGAIVMQYSVDTVVKTFPTYQKSLPFIISLFGLAGSISSIQFNRLYGRRQILLAGAFAASLALFIGIPITLNYNYANPSDNYLIVQIILLVIFVVLRLAMSVALGPLIWLYIAQIIQPNLVPWCFLLNWSMFGLVLILFPLICEWSGGSLYMNFLIFWAVAFVSFYIDKKVMVETKNKTQLEIRKQYDELCKQIKN